MKTYWEFIKEALDSPLPIKWSENIQRIKGIFKSGYDNYVIKALKLKNENNTITYTFKFYLNDGGDITPSD